MIFKLSFGELSIGEMSVGELSVYHVTMLIPLLYIQCLQLNIIIEWVFGSVSTIAPMVIRSWSNNSSIYGK